MVEILIPLAFFASVVLIVYFLSKYKFQTRMAIIEKGGNIEFPKKKIRFLEIGFALIGLGIGLGIAATLGNANLPNDSIEMLNFAFPLLFGGLGLVIAFFTRRRLEQKDNK